ncbi:MAG TPA: sensor histidine kinase [bacterium]|nr:sensor histidine kinase [bacterium]
MKGQQPPAGNQRAEDTQLKQGEFRFEVDSGLLLQLGEELVSKPWVALAELVKNSYDADSTYAIVEFKNVKRPGGEITIVDEGSGIPFDRLQETWMRIATTDKKLHPESPRYKRPRAGAKGIGRFAARRLANKLELVSVVDTGVGQPREQTTIHFDWAAFKPGMDVQSVPVVYERTSVEPNVATGLTLKMTEARDAWTEDAMKELQREVLRVVNPLFGPISTHATGRLADPGFSVQFDAPEFPKFAGGLDEEFLKMAVAVLRGEVDADGKARFRVTFRRGHDEIKAQEFAWTPPGQTYPGIAHVNLVAYYFAFTSDEYEETAFSLPEARLLGREYGGVSIRLDRFRIAPYGTKGDDWLHLDEDRARRWTTTPEELEGTVEGLERPMLLLPGNMQLFGQVQLLREKHPQFRIAADREGLVEDAAFEELKKFVRLGIDWLTVQYARRSVARRAVRRVQRRVRRQSPAQLLETTKTSLVTLGEKIGVEKTREALHLLDAASEAIAEEEQERIGEIQMLRVLASTGTMISVIDHQLLEVLTGLRAKSNRLGRLVEHLPGSYRPELEKELTGLGKWLDDARQLADLLGMMAGKEARTKRIPHNIRELVRDFLAAFESFAKEHGVTLENGVPSELVSPPMYRCELGAILLNLLTNALKAVLDTQRREVFVSAKDSRGNLVLRVSDTGKGADPHKWVDYFMPFVSESEPNIELGTGTGMGLTIVRDLVELYGGEARFVEPDTGYNTAVEARIPYEA